MKTDQIMFFFPSYLFVMFDENDECAWKRIKKNRETVI